MSDTIDNLSIEITSNADKAAASLDRLASSAEKLKGAAKGAGENARDMSNEVQDMGNATQEAGEQSGEAAKKVRNFGKDAKESGNAAKKGTSGITAFWQSLKRIAFYRFIRTVLKEITEAFSEGIKNLYQWSSAVNGRFAKSMDRIATSTLYLKNSLGAMLAPIINTLAPVIEWIIDRIVDVINWINKLFSALSGSQTYTVAKKVATTWDDAGKNAADSAKHAADDIKRTILGFDEINKLEKQNTSSSGGGSGSSSDGIDYTNMFEERRLDGWMSRLASFIDRFKLQIPAVFGTLLGGFAAVKLAISGLAKMSGAWLKSLTGKAISIAVSLVRSGWSTLKGWVLSFGKAIVDVAVKIKTTAAELWSAFALKWAALPTVLQVGIVITTTAAVLWGLYKLAWALVPDKMVEIEATIKTKAADLWRNFKRDWAALGEKIMGVSLTIATSAMILWQNFKRDWAALGEKVMAVGISIATSAVTLWRDFKRDWARVGQKVLTFSLNIATKAQTLWDEFKRDWKQTVTDAVTFGVQISTSAQLVWARFKQAWANVTGKVVSFGLSIANTAESIWLWFASSWALVNSKVLTFSLGIAETAQSIWNSFKEGWNTAKETLSFAVNPVVSPSASTSAPVPSASTTGKNWRQYLLAALGLGVSIFTGVPAFAESGAAAGFGVNDGVMNSYRNQQQIGNWFADRAPSSSKPSGVGRSSVLSDRQSNSLVNDTKNMMTNLSAVVKTGWKEISEATAKAWTEIQTSVLNGLVNLETAFKQRFANYNSMFQQGWYNINALIAVAMTQMQTTVLTALNNLQNHFPVRFSNYASLFQSGWYQVSAVTATSMTQMQYVVLNAVNNLGSVVPSRFVSLANAIANVGWDGVGRQVVYGIGNGINYAWPWLRTLVYNLANAMYRAARNALGIHSPSKLFSDGVGMMIGLGVAEGIDNSAPVVMDALNSINESMRNSLTPFTGVSDYIEAAAGSAAIQYAEQANEQVDNAREIALLQSMLNEMRRLNEKEFTAEVTSSSVQRALNRSNLRAGVTVVPVGN